MSYVRTAVLEDEEIPPEFWVETLNFLSNPIIPHIYCNVHNIKYSVLIIISSRANHMKTMPSSKHNSRSPLAVAYGGRGSTYVDSDTSADPNKLFIGNLSYDTDDTRLRDEICWSWRRRSIQLLRWRQRWI